MYIGDHVDEQPDKPAVIMGRSGTISYRELDNRSTQLARFLRDAGLERGDHLAIFMENQPRFLEVVWAALRSGLYITPINSFLTAPEVAYILDDCGAEALVTSRARADVVSEM
ncbi:MAG: AMP-binding protein, partial [Myxococcota bacterium]